MWFKRVMKHNEKQSDKAVRIDLDLHEKILKRKSETGIPIETQVRAALTEYFEKHQSLESRK